MERKDGTPDKQLAEHKRSHFHMSTSCLKNKKYENLYDIGYASKKLNAATNNYKSFNIVCYNKQIALDIRQRSVLCIFF